MSLLTTEVDESSALAVSRVYDDLAFTCNDEILKPVIKIIQLSTGQKIGQIHVVLPADGDPESIAIDQNGYVWLCDTGNGAKGVVLDRSDCAMYRIEIKDPGRGNHGTPPVTKFPVKFAEYLWRFWTGQGS